MAEPLSTQLLIQQVQEGDRAALDELCARYLPRVLAAVRIRLGAKLRQKLESSDIVQDVMIEAFRKVKSFDFATEGAFLKYLNRVVENRIRDQADRWATQKRDVTREVPLDKSRSPDLGIPLIQVGDRAARTPSSIVSLSEDMDKLVEAMDRLGQQSEDYRELIIAAEIEGRSYKEIAEDAGSTPDAVRMKLTRAKTALAKVYRDLEKGG